MTKDAPVVAELGRPETPEETAARKAEFSKNYRNSQSFRNLIAALIATVVVLAVIVLMVPRGTPTPAEQPDSVAIAAKLSETAGRTVFAVRELPADWQTNSAAPGKDGSVGYYRAVYSPDKDSKTPGFVNLEQAFNADADRAAVLLPGLVAESAVTIDGWEWTEYTVSDSTKSKNVSYALGTQLGDDYVLVYGNADKTFTNDFAADLTAQFNDAKKEQK